MSRPKGVKRALAGAIKSVQSEIAGNASRGGIAGALSGEGYAGGYLQALNDVLLVLNGVKPNNHGGYWSHLKDS